MKKTSINLTCENIEKIERVMKSTGLNKTDVINQAIAEIPIIILGDRQLLAESFFELKKLAQNNNFSFYEEAERVCQFLNFLMEKIEALQH